MKKDELLAKILTKTLIEESFIFIEAFKTTETEQKLEKRILEIIVELNRNNRINKKEEENESYYHLYSIDPPRKKINMLKHQFIDLLQAYKPDDINNNLKIKFYKSKTILEEFEPLVKIKLLND